MKKVRQAPGEPRRRWFSSADLDLIVWLEETGAVRGFQLCYGGPDDERALTWKAPGSYSHAALDDGEDRSFRHKATPILGRELPFDADAVGRAFKAQAGGLPTEIAELVAARLAAYRKV